MNGFSKIVRKWRDAPDLTPEEKREIIERELAWAEEDEKIAHQKRSDIRLLADYAVNRSQTN